MVKAAVVVAVGVGGLASYAIQQARRANEARELAVTQARISTSRELAAAAMIRLDAEPELAVRLAMEAAAVAPTLQADGATVPAHSLVVFQDRPREGAGHVPAPTA